MSAYLGYFMKMALLLLTRDTVCLAVAIVLQPWGKRTGILFAGSLFSLIYEKKPAYKLLYFSPFNIYNHLKEFCSFVWPWLWFQEYNNLRSTCSRAIYWKISMWMCRWNFPDYFWNMWGKLLKIKDVTVIYVLQTLYNNYGRPMLPFVETL